MPYKDEEQERLAARLRKQRQRAKGVTEGVTLEGVTSQGVTGDLTGPWLTVAEYINRPGSGPMTNLERLQHISGSLSKYADQVWYGLGGLTMEDIGKVIGTLPPMVGIERRA